MNTDNTEDGILDGNVGLFGALLAMVTTVVLDAWVVTRLWSWFLVPLGAAAITMRTAAGMDLIANLIIRPRRSGGELTWKDVLQRVVLVPLLALGIGACALRWLP